MRTKITFIYSSGRMNDESKNSKKKIKDKSERRYNFKMNENMRLKEKIVKKI